MSDREATQEFAALEREIERLRAMLRDQAKWLRAEGAKLDEYVTTQHDYYKRANFLEKEMARIRGAESSEKSFSPPGELLAKQKLL